MGLAEALQREADKSSTNPPARLHAFERVQDIVEFLGANAGDLPTSISLDMFIAFREPFHGGWMLWLGDEEVSRLTPQQMAGLPHLPFEEKAQYFFRLSLWTKSKRTFDAVDIVDIPDGQEIYIERVTGIKLFVASTNSPKLAEGNASRVEVVTKVDDDEPEPDSAAPNSQASEGTDSEGTLPGPTQEVMSPLW
ncbi:hypothetical protein F442_11653 [Phytophthora nicotianae P10297]|uniref:Uncharacterized protein n=1 Tax=Phytophthora nicotianae P10297 TaxID=1317064 RepID=W2Z4G5_PHYNI|nr:hypothetical protein F442_11653 [Phytophthora nicotianae P10297]